MKRKLTTVIAAAALSTIVLLGAGCGGSYSSGSGYGSGPDGPPGQASGVAEVGVTASALGRILADNGRRTLYVFEKDENGRSACSGQCATYWPPLLTSAEPVARVGVTEALLGTTRRADGSEQVTYAGRPLYRYFGDSKPGQTNGEGSQEFGGEWNVLSAAGKEVESDD